MNKNYKPFENFVIRLPLKPLKDGFTALQKDESIINKIKSDAIFLDALYLASEDLYNAILNYDKLSDQKKKNLEKSLLKYYLRATARSTPFGLFSSCGIGNYSENYQETATIDKKRITRLDMDVLHSLSNNISKHEDFKNKILYFPNSSMYEFDNQYRYLEYFYKEKNRNYSLEAIYKTEYLSKILKFCKDGKNKSQIRLLLIKDLNKEGYSTDEIKTYIDSLVDIQLLVNELEPNITGEDYLKNLIKKLSKIKTDSNLLRKLNSLDQQLEKLDFGNDNSLEDYNKIRTLVDSLTEISHNKYLFQTDSIINLYNNTLSNKIPRQINESIEVLSKIFAPRQNEYLDGFKIEFKKKYEGCKLPLSFLLDQQTGLDHVKKNINDFDYIDNIYLNSPNNSHKTVEQNNFLYSKVLESYKNGETKLVITNNEVKSLRNDYNSDLPPTFSALIEIYNNDNESLIYLKSLSGSTATNLISRFTQQSKTFQTLTNQICQFEKNHNKDKILAEIVHLPQNRVGNILKSKINRDYEIVYLSGSQKPLKNQILLRDLYVFVRNNKIILYSNKLNKEIIPILSCAHNYSSKPLAVYKFLCELQNQNRNYSDFFLSELFSEFNYIPRIIHKNVILFMARWKVDKKEFLNLSDINSWRKKRLMPRYVQLMRGDNLLLIDFKSISSIKTLRDSFKNQNILELQEFLFNTKNGIKIDDNIYVNEYIIPFYKYEK